jgi:hypothetical protein
MRLLPIVLACAVCVVACGGDDEEPVPSGSGNGAAAQSSSGGGAAEESSSGGAEDWAKQVSAVCEGVEKKTEQLAARVQEELQANDQRLTAALIERTIPLQEKSLDALGEIEPPGDIAGEYDEFLARIGDGVDRFPRLAESVRSGKEDPELAAEFEAIAQDTRPFAAEHELDACVPEAG